MKELLEWFFDLLYPPRCMLCRRLMENSVKPVCGRCSVDLPEFDGPLKKVPYFEKTVAPFFYEEPIRDAVLRFKFRGMQKYAAQFAAWMAIWVRDKLDGEYDLVSWVPCSKRRRWQRGFDQAELLAKALAAELGMEAVSTLKKVKNNRKQSKTGSAAKRRANVLGVYQAVKPEDISGKRILLVDDVLTTGATLSECGKVLRMAGSGNLVCAVIAATRLETKE